MKRRLGRIRLGRTRLGLIWLSSLLVLGSVASAYAQSASPPVNLAEDRPRLLLPQGEPLHLTDSAYLVSTARYRLYQQLHRHVLDTTAGAGDSLVVSYAQSLQAAQWAYDTLLSQYQANDRLSTQTLHRTQLALGQLSRSLDQTQDALTETSRTLNEAKDQLRTARRRSLVQRVAYGAGGLGAGLLIGVLIR